MKKLVAICMGVVFGLLMAGAVQAGLDDGLAAYYPFNGNANDESGNGNHGDPRGGVQLIEDRFGNPNSAYDFDGVDDYIEVPDNDLLSFGDSVTDSPFSISVWIKPAQGQDTVILSKYRTYGCGSCQEYSVDFTNTPEMMLYDAIIDKRLGVKRLTAIDMVWSHIVFVYDGSSMATGIKLYVDGVEQETQVTFNSSQYVAMHNTPEPLRIGATIDVSSNGIPNNLFIGAIDDIRIYNRALSVVEIQEIVCLDEVVKPHEFTPGTPAKAGEVNENFDVLYERINKLNEQVQALKAIVCQDHPTAEICVCD